MISKLGRLRASAHHVMMAGFWLRYRQPRRAMRRLHIAVHIAVYGIEP